AAEGYILANTFGVALVRAVSRVFSPLFGGRSGLALMSMEHRPGLIPNTFTAGEQMVTAGLTCLLAGAGGAIEIGLPLSMIMQVRTRLVPAQIRNHDPSQGLGRSRRLLGATFELEAVLGCVAASLAEVRALKPGSVVMLQKLDAKVPRVELRACDQILCTGTVVEDRGWYRFLIQKKGKIDVESAANR
ncbi:MAG TPA: FliM/FliN family flagellar motor switch protein, partial [Candidatus Binataceae bacterium]